MVNWQRFTRLAAVTLCIFTVALTACGDRDGDGEGGIRGDDVPKLTHNGPLSFSNIDIGSSETQILRIQNTGKAPLNLDKIELVEGNQDQDRELLVGDNWVGATQVQPGNKIDLTIRYKPVNSVRDTGYVALHHNVPKLTENGKPLRVQIDLPGLAPDIRGNDRLSFQSVEQGKTAWKLATIRNAGQSPLKINGMNLGDNKKFYVTYPKPGGAQGDGGTNPNTDIKPEMRSQWPVPGLEGKTELAPGERLDIRVWFEPTDNSAESTELKIVSNDPDQQFFTIDITGNYGTACLGLSHEDKLNFGQSSINRVNPETVTMENCRPRAQELKIKNIRLKDDGGGVFNIQKASLPGDLANGKTFTIVGDKRASFTVTFTPPKKQIYKGTLVIESNDPSRMAQEIQLVGKGSDNQCPTAVAEAKIEGTNRFETRINTLPLETIQFSSKKSQDPDGQIDRYEWSILKRPEDSTARLVPASNRPNPKMFLDLAGTYKVELVVHDDDGAASCGQQAIVTIDAVPNEDIHVQLVWDTPSDTNQTDSDGTDLDLHYLSPRGTWNEAPYDVFWHNKTGDWGKKGVKKDDPSLDIDDTNGAGPENVNHDNPKRGAYKFAVYYYEANGFGESYATVRVYIEGKLKREFKNKYMEDTYDFWLVGIVEWPSKNVYKRDRENEGFPGSNQGP